jgi:glyoxylase-like metal-dependent hydrolase (beta-lactamase superfamily II)
VSDVNAGLRVAHRWFHAEEATDGVTRLWEPFVDPFLESNVWHVSGGDRDLVVDTANGIGALAPAIDALREERPVIAVATHGHFDHVGGLYEFADRRCHPDDGGMPLPGPLRLLRPDFPAWLVGEFTYYGLPTPPDIALTAVPDDSFDATSWSTPAAVPTTFVDEGDVIDLGDRELEVLHTPGHTPGSICLLDARNGVLFSGDAIYVDDRLGWTDGAAFAASLRRLRELSVSSVHAGHGRSFGGDELRTRIDEVLRELDREPDRAESRRNGP